MNFFIDFYVSFERLICRYVIVFLSIIICVFFIIAQTVITNFHRLSGLDSKHLLLTGLDAGNPRSMCQYGQVLDEGPLPDLQEGPPSSCILTWQIVN